MTTREQIWANAQMYQEEQAQKLKRFEAWNARLPELKALLEEICSEIAGVSEYFRDKLTVGEYVASAEQGTDMLRSAAMRSLYVQSANRDLLTFELPDAYKIQQVKLTESGFELHFSPQLNGRINAHAFGHVYGEEKGLPPPHSILRSFDSADELTTETVEAVFVSFLEFAQPTSHLFEQQVVTFRHYPPIGFRYQERII